MPPATLLRAALGLLVASAAALPLAARATETSEPAAPPPRAVETQTRLPPRVEQALARANVPGDAMVAWVAEVEATRPRLEVGAARPVNPASLWKLVTTDAALDMLGPAWTWSTPVWVRGAIDGNGVLDGDVVVKGTGDPKLVLERVWLLMRRLRQMGIRHVRGDFVVDRSAFAANEVDPSAFDGEPLRPYNAGPDALLVNFRSLVVSFWPDAARGVAVVAAEPPLDGVRVDAVVPLSSGPCEDWRGGLAADFADPARVAFAGSFPAACGEKSWPVAYVDPPSYLRRALVGLWKDAGGSLGGTVREGRAPETTPSFELRSPTLAEVVRDVNKLSNNVMAQQIFLTLAWKETGLGASGAAREVLAGWLRRKIGEAAAGVVVVNGSGLSREGRIAARGLGRLLQAAWASAVMPELVASLPVAGVDGTARRATGGPGRAHLKTGSLRDVAGVAGYVLDDAGRRFVVVGIVNHERANAARPALDALVEWTASQAGGRR